MTLSLNIISSYLCIGSNQTSWTSMPCWLPSAGRVQWLKLAAVDAGTWSPDMENYYGSLLLNVLISLMSLVPGRREKYFLGCSLNCAVFCCGKWEWTHSQCQTCWRLEPRPQAHHCETTERERENWCRDWDFVVESVVKLGFCTTRLTLRCCDFTV